MSRPDAPERGGPGAGPLPSRPADSRDEGQSRCVVWMADSEVARLDWQGGTLRLRFAAARVDRIAPDGGPRVEGYGLNVVLVCDAAVALEQNAPLFGRIREARLQADGAPQDGLALPGQVQGPLRLTLEFGLGGRLDLRAQALHLAYDGPEQFRESLAC